MLAMCDMPSKLNGLMYGNKIFAGIQDIKIQSYIGMAVAIIDNFERFKNLFPFVARHFL